MSKKRRSGRSVSLGKDEGASTAFIGALRVDRAAGTVEVDSSKLSPPEVVYDADVAWIDYSLGNLTFVFAKVERDDPKTYRSRLEIRYPPEKIGLTFWKNSQDFLAVLSTLVAKWPAEATAPRKVDESIPARQSHSQWAGLTHLAFAGTEATIDFYHLSANALAELRRAGNVASLKLTPVVRVQLTSFELYRWMKKVESSVDAILASVPKGQQLADIEGAGVEDGVAQIQGTPVVDEKAREYGS